MSAKPGQTEIRAAVDRCLANGDERLRSLALLYAPSILTYESRTEKDESSFRAIARAFRDLTRDALRAPSIAGPSGDFQVLMLALEPRQAVNLQPVARWLRERGVQSGLLTTTRELAGFEGQVIPAQSFASLRAVVAGVRAGWLALTQWRTKASAASADHWLLRILSLKAIEGARLSAQAKEVFARLSPRVVVTSDDCDPRARAFLVLARQRGIPTIVLQFGLASAWNVEWSYLAADTIAALGSQQAGILASLGVAPEKIEMTGSPRFDEAAALASSPTAATVLFASQPNAANYFGSEKRRIDMLKEVYRGLQDSGAQVVVRPHPDEDMELHLRLSREAGLRVRIDDPHATPVSRALSEARTLVTFHSTLALEAALARRQVLLYRSPDNDPPRENDLFRLATSGGWAQVVKGPSQLAEAVRKASGNGNNASIDDLARNLDGRATERIGQLVMERLERKAAC